jgi:CpeT/CpcT family (DUF1001)
MITEMSKPLIKLAQYMAGQFENKLQAIADPAWYVHLHLWQRPLSLFSENSISFYAEQANIVKLDQPYRPRIIRLCTEGEKLQAKYYMIKNAELVRGGGNNPILLQSLTIDDVEFLPSCTLNINYEPLEPNNYQFITQPATEQKCSFSYQGNSYQVELGFEANPQEFKTYDKGIDPQTGKALWGALLGPYVFTKIEDFSLDIVTIP